MAARQRARKTKNIGSAFHCELGVLSHSVGRQTTSLSRPSRSRSIWDCQSRSRLPSWGTSYLMASISNNKLCQFDALFLKICGNRVEIHPCSPILRDVSSGEREREREYQIRRLLKWHLQNWLLSSRTQRHFSKPKFDFFFSFQPNNSHF